MSRAEDYGKRSLPAAYLSTGGVYSYFTWRFAPLQAVRTFEQSTSKEKAAHGEGQMSLTKVGNSSSPSSAERGRQMPVINGEKTFHNAKISKAFAAGMVDRHTASKLRQGKCASTK